MFADTTMTRDLVVLLFWKDSSGRIVILEATDRPPCGPPSDLAALGDEALRWVSRDNRPLVLDNGIGMPGRMQDVLDKTGLWSAAIFPITHSESPIGALVLGCRTGPSPFTFLEPPALAVLGHLLSRAVDRLCLTRRWANEQADQSTNAGVSDLMEATR